MSAVLRVLAVASVPVRAASTRYRIAQYIEPLLSYNIEVTLKSFSTDTVFKERFSRPVHIGTMVRLFGCYIMYLARCTTVWRYDAVWIEREAEPMGPPFLMIASKLARRRTVVDLDDALHARGGAGDPGFKESWVFRCAKCIWKYRWQIKHADYVVCGNYELLRFAEAVGATRSKLVPTAVDTSVVRPAKRRASRLAPVIGWIGSPSTVRLLLPIADVLRELVDSRRCTVRVIAAHASSMCERYGFEYRDWQMDTEYQELCEFDIGVYPLENSAVAGGKSAFKGIQYMALGIPFVVSPIGMITHVCNDGVECFYAENNEQWRAALDLLLKDAELRHQLGQRGRARAEATYSMNLWTPHLAQVLRSAAARESDERMPGEEARDFRKG